MITRLSPQGLAHLVEPVAFDFDLVSAARRRARASSRR